MMNRFSGVFSALTVVGMLSLLAACGSDPAVSKVVTEKPLLAKSAKSVEVHQPVVVGRSGYTCCNLHYAGEAINDANQAQLPFIAAGTPITVKRIDGNRAEVDIDGKPMHLILDAGRDKESMAQWVDKLVQSDDPIKQLANYPPAVRKAIEQGKLMRGMTQEQVIIAVGYPQNNGNPQLGGAYWRYWWSGFAPYYVYWSKGVVRKIGGHSDTLGNVIYKGK